MVHLVERWCAWGMTLQIDDGQRNCERWFASSHGRRDANSAQLFDSLLVFCCCRCWSARTCEMQPANQLRGSIRAFAKKLANAAKEANDSLGASMSHRALRMLICDCERPQWKLVCASSIISYWEHRVSDKEHYHV